MFVANAQSTGPKELRPMPKMRSLLLPSLSDNIPAGSSRKMRERNHAETTIPTSTPDGSRS